MPRPSNGGESLIIYHRRGVPSGERECPEMQSLTQEPTKRLIKDIFIGKIERSYLTEYTRLRIKTLHGALALVSPELH